MRRNANRDELREAADKVLGYVDTHETEPYTTQFASFLVCYAKLEVPRVIGDRTANFLRLFKGLSGEVLAVTIYNEFGFKADSEVLPEMPVRSLTLKHNLLFSTHVFNGTWDANDYPITLPVVNELIADISTATTYVPSPRLPYTE